MISSEIEHLCEPFDVAVARHELVCPQVYEPWDVSNGLPEKFSALFAPEDDAELTRYGVTPRLYDKGSLAGRTLFRAHTKFRPEIVPCDVGALVRRLAELDACNLPRDRLLTERSVPLVTVRPYRWTLSEAPANRPSEGVSLSLIRVHVV